VRDSSADERAFAANEWDFSKAPRRESLLLRHRAILGRLSAVVSRGSSMALPRASILP